MIRPVHVTLALCVIFGAIGFSLGLQAERAGRPEIKLIATKAPCFPGWTTEGGRCVPPLDNTTVANNPGLAQMREPIRVTVPISAEECRTRGGMIDGFLLHGEIVGRICNNHQDGTTTPIAE